MSSERSIPHLRDIFGLSGYTNHAPPPLPPANPSSMDHSIINANNNNNKKLMHSNNGNNNNHHNSNHNNNHINNNNSNNSNKKKRDNNKTMTSGDVKTLERHLSMKKTIRKKIMRDLQQAFVEDPNEFRIENSTSNEQLKAEIKVEALRFGERQTRKTDNFLDMLRGQQYHTGVDNNATASSHSSAAINGANHNRDYDYAPTINAASVSGSAAMIGGAGEKQSFWRRFTIKNKAKR